MTDQQEQSRLVLELFQQTRDNEIATQVRSHYILYLFQEEVNMDVFHYTTSEENGTYSPELQSTFQFLCSNKYLTRKKSTKPIIYALTDEGRKEYSALQDTLLPFNEEHRQQLEYLASMWVDSSIERLIEHTEYHHPEYVRPKGFDWF